MLTWLGVATIGALLALILFRVTSVLVALTLVPVVAALIGGFGAQVGGFAMAGLQGVLPVAVLLAFAVVFFGVMNDAGLFDPVIRGLVRAVGDDPVKIAVGTAAIAAVTHLDGAGASTFMVTVPAMLPLYRRVGMDARTLTCVVALAAGTMNLLPWGGPTTRAAVALGVSTRTLFVPLVPAMAVGLLAVFAIAIHLGRRERARLAAEVGGVGGAPADRPVPETSRRDRARSGATWAANAALTAATVAALFLEFVPLPVVFMVATALALLVNAPDVAAQRERLTAHGHAAMMMVTTIFAAGIFTGVLTGSGMLRAMSAGMMGVLPAGLLRYLPLALAPASMPLSLAFDPDSFYFGLLPVMAEASRAAGGSAVEVGRAALLGQMTTGFPVSPLTPSTFLLVGLAGVDLADHQRRTIGYAFAVTLVMSVAAVATGAISVR